MKKINRRYSFLSLILAISIMSCTHANRFIKKSPIVKFDTDVQCAHPLLRTDGAYFYVDNDTIFPNIYYKFNDDKSVICSYNTGLAIATDRVGIYKVAGDSIYVQTIRSPISWLDAAWSYEIETFIIDGDSSICMKRSKTDYNGSFSCYDVNRKYIFYPMAHPIVATAFQDIRRYKWMWEDKKNWKHWMETH